MSTITHPLPHPLQKKKKKNVVALADASVVSLPFQDEAEDAKTRGAGQSKSYTRKSL